MPVSPFERKADLMTTCPTRPMIRALTQSETRQLSCCVLAARQDLIIMPRFVLALDRIFLL